MMDSFTFKLDKDAIEVIGEALDTAPLARRRTNPVVNTMQEQIIAQQQAGALAQTVRKPRRKRAALPEQAKGEAGAAQAPSGG
jgi:hypothetical protein